MLKSRIAKFFFNIKTYSIVIFLFSFSAPVFALNSITATRVWPAEEYTRITFESDQPLVNHMLMLQNPNRLVLDLDDIDLTATLKSVTDKISPNDPYIQQVRAANFKPSVVRLVIDLKNNVSPILFALKPVGDYKNRLVLDIYPQKDALMTMLGGQGKSDKPLTTPSNTTLPTSSSQTGKSSVITKSSDNSDVKANKSAQLPEIDPVDNAPIAPIEGTSNGDYSDKLGDRKITIAIDAGHGGEDPGARGANGSHEKDITLAVAKKLKEAIDAEPNMRGVLTRDADFFIPLHGRVVKARNMHADLFISIHADAFTSPLAKGSSVFALSERGATSATARYLAKKENESDLIGGVSLDDKDPNLAKTLLDLSQTATINDSLKLGKLVLGQVGKVNSLHKGKVEQAAFAVLKSPDIPSILVETAFISNPEEEAKLNDDSYQAQLVDSILDGVRKYFASNPALAKAKFAQK